MEERVDDGIGEDIMEGQVVEDGGDDGLGLVEELLGEDVELLLVGVDHDEDIHEIVLSVVLGVADDIRRQLPG